MNDRIYQKIELTGTSTTSIEAAIQNAVTRAVSDKYQPRWFELVEVRGAIDQDEVTQWQVTVKIGHALED